MTNTEYRVKGTKLAGVATLSFHKIFEQIDNIQNRLFSSQLFKNTLVVEVDKRNNHATCDHGQRAIVKLGQRY